MRAKNASARSRSPWMTATAARVSVAAAPRLTCSVIAVRAMASAPLRSASSRSHCSTWMLARWVRARARSAVRPSARARVMTEVASARPSSKDVCQRRAVDTASRRGPRWSVFSKAPSQRRTSASASTVRPDSRWPSPRSTLARSAWGPAIPWVSSQAWRASADARRASRSATARMARSQYSSAARAGSVAATASAAVARSSWSELSGRRVDRMRMRAARARPWGVVGRRPVTSRRASSGWPARSAASAATRDRRVPVSGSGERAAAVA